LLFGEYSVLRGGAALAVPLPQFGGKWRYDMTALDKQYSLYDFCEYLKNTTIFPAYFAEKALFLQEELRKGLYFDSNILRGYGAGSSGALTAAVLWAFGYDEKMPLEDLKKLLGKMESFFHGASSGLDPLVCLVQKNILITPQKTIKTAEIPPSVLTSFLIDTHRPRKTEPLVQLFFEKLNTENQTKNIDFQLNLDNELVPNVEKALQALLQGDTLLLWQAITLISFWQFQLLRDMIPLPLQYVWQQGLTSGDLFRLKLCGAGGGGYLLGFSTRPQEAYAFLRKNGFSVIPIS
jgi:mevalonate kinase